MSSLGGLMVFAVFAAISLATMGYLMGIAILESKMISERAEIVKQSLSQSHACLRTTSMKIHEDNKTIEAIVLNLGAGSIPVSDFKLMDIILVYERFDGSRRTVWLPYDPHETLEEGWKALNITYNGGMELLNPTAPDMSSGLWDDGESLAIKLWVSEEILGEAAFLMVAPNGVKTG